MNTDRPMTTWVKGLEERSNGAEPPTADAVPAGVWQLVGQRINLFEQRPQPNSHVISRRLDDRKAPYYVLKNTEAKTYLRLSAEEFAIWSALDGQTTVQELIVNRFMETGDFAHSTVVNLLGQLHGHYMLAEAPIGIWRATAAATERRSWSHRFSAPAQAFMTRPLAIPGVDQFVTRLYNHGGRLLFSRAASVLFALISLLGLGAFLAVALGDRYRLFGPNLISSMAAIWLAALLPVLIHELGHALTVKHYGREIPRAGVMLFFGMPAAFVETTDIWLEPRRARLAVTFNGPYTGLIIGGLAGIFMLLFPASGLNGFLYKMAGFAYLTVLLNANPLLKFDGYYLLADGLDLPALRERSIAFVRRDLAGRIVQRQRLDRTEWLYATYGVLTVLWMFVAIWLALTFWQSRVQQGLAAAFGPGTPLGVRLLGLLIVGAMISLVVLLTLAAARFGRQLVKRYVASGGLARHRQMALIMAGLAVVVSVALPLLFPAYAPAASTLLGTGLALATAVPLFLFARTFLPSHRGVAYFAFTAAVLVAAVGHALRNVAVTAGWRDYLPVGAAVLLIVGGLLLARPLAGEAGRRRFVWGIAGALALGLLLYVFVGFSPADPWLWLPPGLVLAGGWAVAEVYGGARPPALALLFGGGLALGAAAEWSPAMPDLSLLAVLLLAGGALHLVQARLPALSSFDATARTVAQQAIGASMAVMVKRIVAQVYFEAGNRGVERLGNCFLDAMETRKLKVAVMGNQFIDQELGTRPVGEMAQVYGVALDELRSIVAGILGTAGSRMAFAHGLDLAPWENREMFVEVVLARRATALLSRQQTAEVGERRRKLLRRVPLLESMEDGDLARLARRLQARPYNTGDIIIRQGEPGDTFYIVESGVIGIWRSRDGQNRQIDTKGPGQFFGEAALVSQQPRNASAVALTPGTLLALGKADFESLLAERLNAGDDLHAGVGYGWLLREMPLFDELDGRQLHRMGELLSMKTHVAGEQIFCEGEPGDAFYIIESGRLAVTREVKGEIVMLSTLGAGEYVGEIALVKDTPRTATVSALTEATLLRLEGEHFNELMQGHVEIVESLGRAGSRRLSLTDRLSTRAQQGGNSS